MYSLLVGWSSTGCLQNVSTAAGTMTATSQAILATLLHLTSHSSTFPVQQICLRSLQRAWWPIGKAFLLWSSTGCLQKVSHINGKPPKPCCVSHTPLHLLLCSPHSIPCPIPTYSTYLRDPQKAFYGPLPGVRRRSHIKVPLVAYLLRYYKPVSPVFISHPHDHRHSRSFISSILKERGSTASLTGSESSVD